MSNSTANQPQLLDEKKLMENKNEKVSFFTTPTFRALVALILVLIIGAIFNCNGTFFNWDTHRDMLRAISVYGILSCAMTLVIITGGIDLSVGSILALSSVTFSLLTLHHSISVPVAIVACLLVGALCGGTSGVLISRFKVQPFIATLAMMVFARGLAKFISGSKKISTYVKQGDEYITLEMPKIFDFLNARILSDNLSIVTIIMIVCIIICFILINKMRYGRQLFAIGGNEDAAKISGVPVNLIKIVTYALSGFFCAIAGICQAAQEYQGDPEAGVSYELTAIAMVVIGGTSLSGGRGSILWTLIGILTMGYLEKILSINAVGEDKRLILTGIIIVGAVLFQKRKN